MANWIKTVLIGIIFSCYYFPFEFTFLPGINTKMILAVIGIILLVLQWIKEMNTTINKVFISVSIWAALFSLFSFFSVTYNVTTDYTYATYIVKMWVWWSAAYAVLYFIREVHSEISIRLVFHYMAWVCAVQAVLGIVIDNIPIVQGFVDKLILQDIGFLHTTNRLYGIGAYFDTAGIRFSCALLGLGYLLTLESAKTERITYFILFLIIAVFGNIMSRTTSVGMILSILYIILVSVKFNFLIELAKIKVFTYCLIIGGLLCCVIVYYYNNDYEIREYINYGFEGFFNLYKEGEWSTGSTDRLQNMYVLPDNIKTWLIGDGWFQNPDDPTSFYKYTDIGFLRLIFYSGTIGLGLFILLFIHSTILLNNKWNNYKLFFFMIFLLQLIVWIKISTDIFLVYAMLLLLEQPKQSEDNIKLCKSI